MIATILTSALVVFVFNITEIIAIFVLYRLNNDIKKQLHEMKSEGDKNRWLT